MTAGGRPRPGPFVLAVGMSLALILSAPFVGQLRSVIRRDFPGQYVNLVGALLAIGLALALGAAAWRIRDRRGARYARIVAAVGIAIAYSLYRAGPNAESNAVERFHFLQYGLIAFLFYRAWHPLADFGTFLLPVLAGLIVGTAEEWLQWFIPNRVGEIADVWLNLVAIGTGLLFSTGLLPPLGWRGLGARSRQTAGRLVAAVLVALAAFVHIVHLGTVVQDPEVGSFASRFSGERLLELQSARAAQWTAHPPPTTLVRLSREDQYLTEGIQHVRERNAMWTAGDIAAAWRENRILEKYFAPVLDTPTHEGSGHRWPPAQRADAEARGAVSSEPYVSDAFPSPILTWSPLALWLGAISLAAVTVWLTRSLHSAVAVRKPQ